MGKAAHPNHKDHCVVYYYRNQEALQRKARERAQREILSFRNAEKLRVSAKELAPILAAMDGASESLESGNSTDTRRAVGVVATTKCPLFETTKLVVSAFLDYNVSALLDYNVSAFFISKVIGDMIEGLG
ncbi:uncharacterized protein LACBIDRAFT_328412 [Laccaria bicolor S238N-H82]|uniref:Predicted protein n=1 Tax=Laccaria bicolor (strain S238N-H82 / ATCC MYA-4686) TaxID=486041 RepID=B0DET0_LACBS|nr:uncharacterized protein LACBIDRAFT_328412 [Laccaria bicolor S238N-H82]EDR06993.1 predicted protein [Laccaria bicolor S238N-H82]|eukprot:XP_001882366.1 predicted protein [Laccaria bicolor S238N-H82]